MNHIFIAAGLVCLLTIGNSCPRAVAEEVTVTMSRPVHPLLVRNEAGPLLKIVVDVQHSKDLYFQAMHFKLDGTDDIGDLESLSLFATSDKQEFSMTTLFGKAVDPAKMFVFRGNHLLRQGKNVFWLSCRLKPTANLSHKVKAVCTSVETNVDRLSVIDLSPGVQQRIGIALRKSNDDGVHTYRIPALTTTPKGTLLCVYDMRRRMGRDLQEDIDIGLSRSSDGGRLWEPVRVIMDMGKYGGLPEEQNGCSDPGIIVDHKTGEIFCFAVWMNGNPGKHQWNGDGSGPGYEIGKAAQILMVTSKDDGRTWTKPVNLTRTLKKEGWWLFAPSPQAGINLRDGTLVMPTQGRDEKGVPFANIMYSKDHGKTWTVSSPAFSGGNECQAVELSDGAIMLNMRNDHDRHRAIFLTKDLGKTWQPHETNRKALIEPNCNGSLLRVDYTEGGQKKHALLFSNPHTQQSRTHQTIQVSFDEGRTWPKSHHLLLDEGRGAGYPSLTRVDDYHIGIVYEGSQAHLVFEKIPLKELLNPSARSAAVSKLDDWPQFRGPNSDGHVSGPPSPLEWSDSKNIAWKAPIAGLGWSSPTIAEGKVFLTTAVPREEGLSLRALALDAKTGKVVWDREVRAIAKAPKIHAKNSHASPTPVVRDGVVFVHFGALGMARLAATDGALQWTNFDLDYPPVHGSGGSPVLHDGKLVIVCDGSTKPFVAAIDAKTGKIAWKQPRSVEGRINHSFVTPTVAMVDGKAQVMAPGPDHFAAYDLSSGVELWRVRAPGWSVVPQPALGHGLVIYNHDYDFPELFAVKLGGKGDVTDSHIVWRLKKGAPSTPSPLLIGNELYFVSDNGNASCVNAKTGERHWMERLGGSANYSASPVFANGRILFLNEDGLATWVQVGKNFAILGQNRLPGRTLATPSFSGGAIYLRTDEYLYKIGQ